MSGRSVGTVRDPATLRRLQAIADGMEASELDTALVDLKDGRYLTLVLIQADE